MGLKSFIEIHPDSHFPIQNLPFGVFKPEPASDPRPGVAIGDTSWTSRRSLRPVCLTVRSSRAPIASFSLISTSSWVWDALHGRKLVQQFKSCSTEPALRDNASLRQKALVPIDKVEMLVPIAIGDYTDFFSSMHHAKNCGTIFRGPENPIPANWFHLPIAYHGRASSIVISGTDIVRPRGQGHPAGNSPPYFGPSRKLDFELEMAAVVGPGNELGKPIDVNEAADHIFGVVLMNDWSGTTVSPWIVTLDALEPFVCDAPKQNPPPLPYLAEKISKNYDISLEVRIKPAGEEHGHVVTKSNFKHLYWTLTQQLAHHTINGCNLRPGDLLGTGTISGPEPESYGCLLELTWNGQNQLSLGGTNRKFLEDGDEVIFTGCSKGNDYNVGFGTCSGKILPSPL
ncbi:hypothetical protein HYC85_011460 [Camellia sinensis]|uniref:Fumarylacetoacetase n=1 Tax=Camellia sinensis TaxID=4442 RepID=A0A7J7HAB9_CAMSI|nr:hypothetical protein HYC85_011460 [Camellia sinensis]